MGFSQGLLEKPHIIAFLKAAVCRCSTKVGLLKKICKFTANHLCPSFFVIELQALSLQLYILKKRLQHWCLPVNFAIFFRRPTFEENLQAAAFGNAFFI